MKWNELKKQALKHGVQFVRHGKEHDEYYNPKTGVTVQLERHGSQEVRKGLAFRLKKTNRILTTRARGRHPFPSPLLR